MGKRWIKAFGLMAGLMAGSTAALAASAPPLTEVKVVKVQSPACGLEDIGDNQPQTQCNHSGPSIKVFVLEIGYGQNQPHATLDGFEVNGTRAPVCAWPVMLGRTGLERTTSPSLTNRDRVAMDEVLSE